MTGRCKLLIGNVEEALQSLPSDSVRCCVTSPPYWGLRDYGFPGQIGLEATPERWAERLVTVFREVRRVLTPDGTLWLNLGDSYAGARRGGEIPPDGPQSRNAGSTVSRRRDDHIIPRSDRALLNVKPKDLIGQPWLLAFALRADGWFLRADIVWHKPNPMPESAKDRPTKAHEYIFLLSRSARYFYDTRAASEPVTGRAHSRGGRDVPAGWNAAALAVTDERPGARTAANNPKRPGGWSAEERHDQLRDNGVGWGYAEPGAKPRTERDRTPSGWDQRSSEEGSDHHGTEGRYTSGNKARKQREDHGGPEGTGRNQAHSVPWTDTTGRRNGRSVWSMATQPYPEAHFATFPEALARRCIVAGSAKGDTVLDPFGGSGTTGAVATALGRNAIHIDGQPDYTALAMHRIGPMFCDREVLP